MTALLVVIVVGVTSYLFRVSMLVLAHRRGVPAIVERAARFAVPAAFAALVATSLGQRTLTAVDANAVSGAIAPWGAVAAAVIAVRRTRSPHAALLVGMPAFWILSAIWR